MAVVTKDAVVTVNFGPAETDQILRTAVEAEGVTLPDMEEADDSVTFEIITPAGLNKTFPLGSQLIVRTRDVE